MAGSGSISQRYGPPDPDPHPDSYQNFMDSQHCILYTYVLFTLQGVDDMEYGGAWELTKEGFLASFAGFLVTWIIIYTGIHA